MAVESLTEKAYAALKEEILSCLIAPGEVINEKAVAGRLGISKTPVRHAINKLTSDGFVEVFPRQGTLVRRITVRDVKNVYVVRELTEPGASALAATRANPDDIAQLERLDEQLLQSGATGPVTESIDLERHASFHVAVAAITRVPQLVSIITGLHDQLRWFLAAQAADGGPRPPKRNHRLLLDAIRSGDADRAREITAESISVSRDWLLRSMITLDD